MLFTDLVGSTDLLVALGADAYDDLRGAHFGAVRDAVSACGGTEVKNTGDGLLVTFGSAADAVDAAVAVQRAVRRQALASGLDISVRVGLALGDVTFEDDDVFGTPVVEAARLVAAAAPGQILAAAVVPVVAGGRSGAAFVDLGPMELKGLPAPLAVCEVAWEPEPELSPVALPLPPMLATPGRIFVGRSVELERMEGAWKEAVAGERRVVLLGGEPGIGKTRLATELARKLHAGGAVVLAGRCDEDLGVPYQPFVEALRHYVAGSGPALVRGAPRLGRHPGELVRLVPELAQIVPGLPEPLRSDPETERYRLFDGLASWLSDVSVDAPVVLVLDDLQWAAKPTLLLLRHVLRSAEPLRLLVVGTYRDTDIGRGHPLTDLLGDLRREAGTTRLGVGGLDASGVAAFVEAAGGQALSEDGETLARAIHDETEGNPFFVAEVLRHLAESGAITQRDGVWATTAALDDLGIPEGVRDVVGRRLSRLTENANRTLATAAVIGTEFDLAVLAAVGPGGAGVSPDRPGGAGVSPGSEDSASEDGEDALLEALEEAAAARVVVEVPGLGARYRFAHALIRATLYDELSAGRRQRLHRRVAEAIEVIHGTHLDDHLPALARHYARAAAPAADTVKAVDYALRAAQRALALLAHDEAVTWYRSALDLADGADPRRLSLMIDLGEAQRRAGDPAFRATLLEAAERAEHDGDGAALVRAASLNRRPFMYQALGEVDAAQVDLLERALAALGERDSPARARLLAHLGVELCFSLERPRRVELADEALAMARRLGDRDALADVLLDRYYTVVSPETLPQRLTDSAELLGLAGEQADPVLSFRAAWISYRNLIENADVAGARDLLVRAEQLADELRQPILVWLAAILRTGFTFLEGGVEETNRRLRDTFELGRVVSPSDADRFWAIHRSVVLAETGAMGEMVEWLEGERSFTNVYFDSCLALAYCHAGRTDAARPIFAALAKDDFTHLPRNATWFPTLALCVYSAGLLGDVRAAGVLLDLMSPYQAQLLTPLGMPWGAGSYFMAVAAATAGRTDEAARLFDEAEATHVRLGATFMAGRTRTERARLLG